MVNPSQRQGGVPGDRYKNDKKLSQTTNLTGHPKLMGQKEIASDAYQQIKNQTTEAASTEFGGAKHSYVVGTVSGTEDLQQSQRDIHEQFPSSRYETM
jgi:hypothetical protein